MYQDHFLALVDGVRHSRPGWEQFNFTVKEVLSGQSIKVPTTQQMLFVNDILVSGDLLVEGDVVDCSPRQDNGFFYTKIIEGESVTVPANRLLLYKRDLLVYGNLYVVGTVEAC